MSCTACSGIDCCSKCASTYYPKAYDPDYAEGYFLCVKCTSDGEFVDPADNKCKLCTTKYDDNTVTCTATTITKCKASFYKHSSTADTNYDHCIACDLDSNKPVPSTPTDGTGLESLI